MLDEALRPINATLDGDKVRTEMIGTVDVGLPLVVEAALTETAAAVSGILTAIGLLGPSVEVITTSMSAIANDMSLLATTIPDALMNGVNALLEMTTVAETGFSGMTSAISKGFADTVVATSDAAITVRTSLSTMSNVLNIGFESVAEPLVAMATELPLVTAAMTTIDASIGAAGAAAAAAIEAGATEVAAGAAAAGGAVATAVAALPTSFIAQSVIKSFEVKVTGTVAAEATVAGQVSVAQVSPEGQIMPFYVCTDGPTLPPEIYTFNVHGGEPSTPAHVVIDNFPTDQTVHATVQVTNFPEVQRVHVDNTVEVALDGTIPVNVENTPTVYLGSAVQAELVNTVDSPLFTTPVHPNGDSTGPPYLLESANAPSYVINTHVTSVIPIPADGKYETWVNYVDTLSGELNQIGYGMYSINPHESPPNEVTIVGSVPLVVDVHEIAEDAKITLHPDSQTSIVVKGDGYTEPLSGSYPLPVTLVQSSAAHTGGPNTWLYDGNTWRNGAQRWLTGSNLLTLNRLASDITTS